MAPTPAWVLVLLGLTGTASIIGGGYLAVYGWIFMMLVFFFMIGLPMLIGGVLLMILGIVCYVMLIRRLTRNACYDRQAARSV